MKKMRKLIPAFCMLLLSAVMLSTSTFAWFSMNKSVSATGMQITAKADSIFLLINTTGTAASGDTTLDLSAAANLFPAAIDNAANAGTATNWYTAAGTNRTDGTIKNDTKTNLTTENFDKYVVKKTVYLTLATGSKNSGELTVKATTFTDSIGGAAKVIAICGSNAVELTSASLAGGKLADSVSASSCVQVDIYFYFDGNDTDITTANFEAGTLTTASVALQFDVAEP